MRNWTIAFDPNCHSWKLYKEVNGVKEDVRPSKAPPNVKAAFYGFVKDYYRAPEDLKDLLRAVMSPIPEEIEIPR